MSQRPYRSPRTRMPRRPRESANSCLGQIALFGVTAMVLIALYAVLVRPYIGSFIGDQIGDRLGMPAESSSATGEQIAEQAGAVLPAAIAALPPGEIILREDEANAYLAQHQGEYAPVDSIRLRFTPGQVEAETSAFGASGVVRSGLIVQNGQIVLVDPQIDGLLGLVVSGEELTTPLTERLNLELARQGRTVTEVRIESGQLVFVTSS